ncbi:MAG TPA: universal stress protein [Streptosporangiaceae bacterium]|nr:universal stress protein [Streptosporangiaceae bacterium]
MSVVVGVDGTAASQAAIQVAAQEARYRQTLLIAVMAYSGARALRAPAGQPVATAGTGDDERAAAESSLRHLVSEALGNQADHVELRVVAGIAGRQIVEAAREVRAQLIVLATRGSMSLLLGTVGQYVLRKAPCPVLVVPAGPSAG